MDCGKSQYETVLQFDHRDPSQKVGELATLDLWMSKGLAVFEAELEKTDCVCISCHKLRTRRRAPPLSTQPSAVRKRATMMVQREKEREHIMMVGMCECGCNTPITEANITEIEFDHVDPRTKHKPVSQLRVSPRLHAEEMKKCRVLLAACHLRITRAYEANERMKAREKIGMETLPHLYK